MHDNKMREGKDVMDEVLVQVTGQTAKQAYDVINKKTNRKPDLNPKATNHKNKREQEEEKKGEAEVQSMAATGGRGG
jgi:hypothetical protein